VLRFVCGPLAERLKASLEPDVLCGTSIGALTAAWMGAFGKDGARQLSNFWQQLEPDRVYRLNSLDLARVPLKMLQGGAPLGKRISLLNPLPLHELIHKVLPWDKLHQRLDSGALKALVVAATDVGSGVCVQFSDGLARSRRATATTRIQPARIGPAHVLASAAIPFVFPVVQVEGGWFADGALRQNTPLSPAIELGVTRALVIGCTHARNPQANAIQVEPTPAFLAGKALTALLMDPVEEDIRRLNSLNKLLEWGEQTWPDFHSRLSQDLRPYRVVKTVYLRPSQNIATLASECFKRCVDLLPGPTRT
jgi:NTE family protein